MGVVSTTERRTNYRLLLTIGSLPVLVLVTGALFWVVIFPFCDLESKAASVGGPAPKGEFAVRRAWGEKHLGKYLVAAESWIRKNKDIESDIGRIVGVAPVDGPNRYCDGFGECWATMNLQIIGENGEGVLELSEVSFDGRTNRPYVEVAKTPWEYRLYEQEE